MSSRRRGGQVRCCKDTVKTTLKQHQINPTNWEDFARNRAAWWKTVKTGAAIYEDNRKATAKAKRATRKSRGPRINTTNAQALPTYPRYQRTFRAQIGLVGHLRTQCDKNPSTSANPHSGPPSPSSTVTHATHSATPNIIVTTSQYSGVTSTDTTTTTTPVTTTTSDGNLVLNCSHCDRTFTARIGLVDHLRIHRRETGEPVLGGSEIQSQRPPPLPSLLPYLQTPHWPTRSHAPS
ncbi:unnamed protein product [Schistocephalus solidus]|uniref:C2H2-type domain-containing protein n=1 Tax=Schistocephalus solidus TaxID=70667 RepID=A0A183TPS2_SCHSO|nr:unnamed protein product [Schistocephalus solidus]